MCCLGKRSSQEGGSMFFGVGLKFEVWILCQAGQNGLVVIINYSNSFESILVG